MRHRFSGTGPGTQTPDGCSVDFYRALPYMGELEDIEPALRRHTSALELGCGNGRLSKRMGELGLKVTGVDESPDMLAHLPPDVEGVLSSIERLDLGCKWPVVLLPSHLINHPAEDVRSAFLAAARLHLSIGGTFFVKRHDPSWLATVPSGFIGSSRGVDYHAEDVRHVGSQVRMTLRYEAFGQSWTQSFSTTALSEVDVQEQLHQHGFEQIEWFGPHRLWAGATASDF